MNIPNDPVILLSYINTQLRDNYSSLDEFCKSASVSKEEIEKKLESVGYKYDENRNCLK